MAGQGSAEWKAAALKHFATYLAMAFHEARNVRFPIRAGRLSLSEAAKYSMLTQLASKRDVAWEQLQALRGEAGLVGTAEKAERIFAQRFGLGLEELALLYQRPIWRASYRGGNKWSGTVLEIIKLRQAIDAGEAEAVTNLLEDIPKLEHNTGTLGVKLAGLDAPLGGRPGVPAL